MLKLVAKDIIEASPDAIAVVDGNGIIALVNAQTEALFGYSRAELLGRPIEMLVPERQRERHGEHRAEFMRRPRVRPMAPNSILYGRRRSGDEFPIDVGLSPLDAADEPAVVCAIRDATVHREIQSALEVAKDVAQRETAAKTRFLAAASHDLRQPLQSLDMYLTVLTRRLESAELLEVSGKMRDSIRIMRDLLDTLLDISKLEAGAVPVSNESIELRALLERVVTDNVPQAESKGLALECDCPAIFVHSDPVLLERIIENFVGNAIRYTESGYVRIHVERHGSDSVRIAVTDTGAGIPASALDRVFDEYYQLDNAVGERRKGLGLGLSIVDHISRLLKHRLDVKSELGRGSTFSVDVPLDRAADDVASVTPEQPLPATDRHRSREPVMLFVDDDPAIIDATTMLMKTVGVDVHTATSAEEALDCIDHGLEPDIVVSDYRLPQITGLELVRKVRTASGRSIQTVIMTGDTGVTEIQEARLPDCTVLHKPIDTDRLIQLIDSIELDE